MLEYATVECPHCCGPMELAIPMAKGARFQQSSCPHCRSELWSRIEDKKVTTWTAPLFEKQFVVNKRARRVRRRGLHLRSFPLHYTETSAPAVASEAGVE